MNSSNTFIFNLEWYAVLQEYPEEVRFEVYEAIMRYASSGTLPELKPLAKMAFSFIRKEMDYNRDRYQATVEKRREAGRSGGLARKRALRGTDTEDAEPWQANEANATDAKQTKQCLANEANAMDARQCLANEAKPSYIDNDNVNDNELSSTTARGRARDATAGVSGNFLDDLFRDTATVEAFCMNNRISPDQFRRLAEEVVTEWQLTGQTHADETDARRHLINQTRIKIHANDTQTQDRYAKRRGVDSAARGPEDYTGEV